MYESQKTPLPAPEPKLWGLLAEYKDADALRHAAQRLSLIHI